MKENKPIFFGKNSATLWKDINKVGTRNATFYNVWGALYHLACRCQELEAKIEKEEK